MWKGVPRGTSGRFFSNSTPPFPSPHTDSDERVSAVISKSGKLNIDPGGEGFSKSGLLGQPWEGVRCIFKVPEKPRGFVLPKLHAPHNIAKLH